MGVPLRCASCIDHLCDLFLLTICSILCKDLHLHGKWEHRYMGAWGDSQQFRYHGDRRAYLERDIFVGPKPPFELPGDAFYMDVFLDETDL